MVDDLKFIAKPMTFELPPGQLTPEWKLREIDHFKNVPALAKRLGVQSIEDDPDQPRDLVVMTGGESYSIIAIVNAFLDRLEAKGKK